MDMTAFRKRKFIKSAIFMKQNTKYSTSKYYYGILGANPWLLQNVYVSQVYPINLNVHLLQHIYYQKS